MITTIENLPTGTIGFRASGVISAEDYRDVLEPAMAAAHASQDTVNFVYVIGQDVERFSLGAMAQDAKVGATTPATEFGRIAVVTDTHWIAGAVHFFLHFYRCEVQVFAESDEAEAIAWAAAG